jgi:hypothetical protein
VRETLETLRGTKDIRGDTENVGIRLVRDTKIQGSKSGG